MASSSETMKDVEKQWSNICLDEEEEFVTELEEDVRMRLSTTTGDYQVFQNVIADLWKPGKGMYVKILEQNRFLFQFYHEIDIDRVITGSPWTYDRKQLLIERLRPGDNPRTKLINHLDLWVQIHNLQPGFKTENVVRQAGKYIGSFLETDPNNFKGVWRERQNFLVASPWLRSAKQHAQSGVVEGEGNGRGANAPPQFKEAFNSVSNYGKSVYFDHRVPADHVRDARDADITIVNGDNGDKGPSIVINGNDSTFMSDDEFTILDLKRKRGEKGSSTNSFVANTVDME
ncbi:hypothetical protein F8388_003337 [Cannabis sativa]|uniref:DUF4283 domain-containing protein n=1 Tax=Cannabis sativa TaxID=3483 RepID=A0A7J6EHL0_CANSA|nr:hypothetical protein F8388_003337 [Cannabis sativa]KAF4366345.1 hypothetical protein G4B88_026672 [Cannabis sativa]